MKIILENDVQKSLRNKELQEVEKNALSKYFAYIDLNHVADYCYIDNKEMFTKNPIPRLVIRIFQATVCVRKWGMSMRRRDGSGPGLPVWYGDEKHCLSEDM